MKKENQSKTQSESSKEDLGAGLRDKPSKQDQLEISKHIGGLSKFLVECDNPMTVSIQGEWGTGKSSIMEQLIEKISTDPKYGNDVANIRFNTWQYSQFSFDNQLPIILLDRLISKISEDNSFDQDKDAKMKKLKNTMKGMLENAAIVGKTGVNAFTQYNFNISFFNKRKKEESIGEIYKEIEKFKTRFEELVNDSSRERFIIYIDDLDRLVPEKAVELLEVLKIFLDVNKCVFVLAIDYDVVVRGVADKYGFDMNNPKELEKGKNFFDKIIQVPYSVPLEEYKLEGLIKSFLKFDDRTIDDYNDLLARSVGKNPRSIKRIFNMFKLNKNIKATPVDNENPIESLLLFMFTCMQNEYPLIYSYIINNGDTVKRNIEALMTREINEDFFNVTELIEELDKSDSKGFLSKSEEILKNVSENVLEKVAEYSTNTFISKQKENSRLKVFDSLDSLIEYFYKKEGKTISYEREDIQTIEDQIMQISDEIEKEYKGNENVTAILFKVKQSIIAEIHIYKNSFSVKCLVGGALKNNKHILEILSKYGLELTKANTVTINIMKLKILENEESNKDFIKIISTITKSKLAIKNGIS